MKEVNGEIFFVTIPREVAIFLVEILFNKVNNIYCSTKKK